MNKISIPKTDLHASTLALGTDYFGSTVSRDLCMELMDHYIEAGGNVIDTAESYARWLPGGEYQSEKVIGEWLRERRTRDQIVLSTKGAHPKLESMDVPRLSKAEIQADLDSSLQRLGVEHIDLYWLHRDSPGYPVEEILESLETFRKAGKIKYRWILKLDAITGGGSAPGGGALGRPGLCRKSEHVEPGEARHRASRSNVGLHRRVIRPLAHRAWSLSVCVLNSGKRVLSTPRAKHAGQSCRGCPRPNSL